MQVLIVEDVGTTGGSIARNADICRAEGLAIKDAYVFVDWDEGAIEELKEYGLNIHSLVTRTEIMKRKPAASATE